ncbi:MAG: hypothetical protein ACI39F_02645 [Acutalibacteraceae bacterium]
MKFTIKNKKLIAGYTLIAIVIIVFGIITFYLVTENNNLKAINENYKIKKDCTLHLKQISELKNERTELENQIKALQKPTDSIIEDAEYFLKQYYYNDNSTAQEQADRIKPLVTPKIYKLYTTNEFETNEINYGDIRIRSGVEEVNSWAKKLDDSKAEVFSTIKYFVKVDNQDKNFSTILFDAELTYSADTDKWIVSKIISQKTINVVDDLRNIG